MMKNLLLPIVIILVAITARAQDTGMPKELTCTERAFNFSVGIGTGWKFTIPKMGPVEAPKSFDMGNNPAWGTKVNPTTYETGLTESYWSNIVHLQNDASAVYFNKTKANAMPGCLFPVIKFGPIVKSSILWPDIPAVRSL